LVVEINGNCSAQQEISVSTKVSKEIVSFQQELPNLGVWCKKWSKWTSGVRQKNPTPTPPKKHPTPQPCAKLMIPGTAWVGEWKTNSSYWNNTHCHVCFFSF